MLLRADIDALPVKEATGLPFASRNEAGCTPAGTTRISRCSSGAAKILTEMRGELGGTVKFFFQPAEELALRAKGAVERGLMKALTLSTALVWGLVDAGKINIAHGERMASCDMFTLTVRGEASHGSAPHLGRDAVVAASAVIMALQTIVSRVNNPLNSLAHSRHLRRGAALQHRRRQSRHGRHRAHLRPGSSA
ncbi:MAG: M20/M25/M40 family metallo-hydrolase [Cloacibacillus evryensis]